MRDRIYLCELESYKNATQKQKKSMHTSGNRFFDLSKLPNETLKKEMESFLQERGNRLSITSIARELPTYELFCRFICEKEKHLKSFRDKPIEELVERFLISYANYTYDLSSEPISSSADSLMEISSILYVQ